MASHRTLKRTLAVVIAAVPVAGLTALVEPVIVADAAVVAYPVMCDLSATVQFAPAMTPTGTDTTNKAAVTTTTISNVSLQHCLSSDPHGAPTSGTVSGAVSVRTPGTKMAKIGSTQHYAIGYCPAFTTTETLKSLKGLTLTVAWTGGAGGTSTFVVSKAFPAVNLHGEIGFVLQAKPGAGSYSQKLINQITAYLDAADSATLATGCKAGYTSPISMVTIDPALSTAAF